MIVLGKEINNENFVQNDNCSFWKTMFFFLVSLYYETFAPMRLTPQVIASVPNHLHSNLFWTVSTDFIKSTPIT